MKRALLEHLKGEKINLERTTLNPLYFIYLSCFSQAKEKLLEHCTRKLIEIEASNEDNEILITNYTSMNLHEYAFTLLEEKNNIAKSGMEYLTCNDIQKEMKNCKNFVKNNPEKVLEAGITKVQNSHGKNFSMIAYKKEEEEKYKAVIHKYINTSYSKEEINRKI